MIKTGDHRWKVAEWIVERFPENYREMTYLEPFLGCGSVFVRKDPSKEEILNDPDASLMNIWWALRDEHDFFTSKLKRTKYNESVFRRTGTPRQGEDYLFLGLREFVLRQMSKNGMKKSFLRRKESKDAWSAALDSLRQASVRAESSFLMCRDSAEVLTAFDLPDTFVYFNSLDGGMSQEKQSEVGDIIKNYRGKVLVLGQNSASFRRTYSDWNRKGVPGSPKESVWMNF